MVEIPAYRKALDLAQKISDGRDIEIKKVKMVRTVSGMRRYQQDKGSIIIRDGESPLDGLAAATNDIPGYEKLTDKNGNAYYIGLEDGRYVVRNPADNSLMYETSQEDEAYIWLNRKVGGGKGPGSQDRSPFDASPNVKPTDDERRNLVRSELSRNDTYGLDAAQASAVDTLEDDEIEAYKRNRDRGLSHQEAYRLSQKPGTSGYDPVERARQESLRGSKKPAPKRKKK